ncbi:ABC transporter permease [Sphaerochaeta globosa]|uniref:ABC-type transporter, integral membrane subunit n=1 Tax=Sphaerochaeta globosa (strain ATCC BAA-1886 / DSM 22777 / Buddy) TaxID=158189 RepID=F0RS11_SPHGB|nr:ABC transporter permease [Sphaerochaeta globosa]ADY14616.1 ABC-type transporter, integral membrane subunit [Sphaerochaeta globosa str. Buddy]
MKLQMTTMQKVLRFMANNTVPILFLVICAFGIPLSGYSANYLLSEIIIRIVRNSFLIVSLLIPILAGMGLNFGMTLGAMAGQIGLIFISDWGIVGIPGMLLAMIISTPISIVLGWWCGKILNMAKGREMVTSYIIGFFMNGIYQLIVLYGMGAIIPIRSNALLLPRGYGIRNTVNLIGIRKSLDDLLTVRLFNIPIPLATFALIAILCLFVLWFKKTKLGQDMRAVGQDMEVARAAGIRVEHTRIISIIISTVFAGFGMIVYMQNIGTLNTYNSHMQIGMFSVAALLVGGATVAKANIRNVFLGVILFHLMFIVSPMAGKNLIGQAQLGEYFRVFVSYGVITISLVLYEVRKKRDENIAGLELAAEQEVKA